MKLLFFLFILFIFISIPNQSHALIKLISPEDRVGEEVVDKVKGFFEWSAVPEAVKYVLDIDKFDESIDNLGVNRCQDGSCSINFLELPQNRRPNYNTIYQWKISAYNKADDKIDTSSTRKFLVAQRVVAAPDTSVPSGGTSSPSGGGGIPAVLENPISSATLPELLKNVLNFLFSLSIVILPIIILYGGFLMLTAGGDPTKISQSRTILLWAIVAFAIILLARGLPEVIRTLL